MLNHAQGDTLTHTVMMPAEWESSPRGLLALILVLDQFSRHAYRRDHGNNKPHAGSACHEGEDDEDDELDVNAQEQMAVNNKRALDLSKLMLARSWDNMLSPQERIFAIMPMRHSPTLDGLEFVLFKVCMHVCLHACIEMHMWCVWFALWCVPAYIM
jgi:uncharacterized protein (DUF924 family)